eukprot:m.112280 g.112280  ORF g.112280 m.112280 type:complete len:382 (+) comp9394_c0_seq1:358-1503(+)
MALHLQRNLPLQVRTAARGLQTGLVGLPNVGKSSLFNALTGSTAAEAANFPFCTIEPNVGRGFVRDPRLLLLRDLYGSKKIVPTALEFVDIAGLVEGASAGKGQGNAFLSHVRQVDCITHVVRCFGDSRVIHVSDTVSPTTDIETINLELILADLEVCERRLKKIGRRAAGDEQTLLSDAIAVLQRGEPARKCAWTDSQKRLARGLGLITTKPVIYAANVSEEELGSALQGNLPPMVQEVQALAEAEGAQVSIVSADVEAQIAVLEEEDKAAFLQDLGIERSACESLTQAVFHLLGLRTFFTAGEREVRAWTIPAGTTAAQAAGVIHSDFERKFIKAEVLPFAALVAAGSEAATRAAGDYQVHGRDYEVAEGDIINFRHNA